ncbi:MAG TPA: IS1595 family transposase [Pseudolabrys sp.]
MAFPRIYTDENAAREHLEALLWPDGPVCPHCRTIDQATRLQGKSTRPGLLKCRSCEKPFSVTVGTVFERSKIKLHQWVYASHLLTSSKKGISSHQLSRMLGVTYKTAWFMAHRIREAMRPASLTPMGGSGKTVEVDETIIGKLEGAPKRLRKGGSQNRNIVLSVVERGGAARSWHIDGTTVGTLLPILRTNVRRESVLMTDEASWYRSIGREYANHLSVNHREHEYSVGEITTNTVEGYFSIFKRGMKGVYQHCSEKHLHRYLSEFDFRYSNRIALGVDDAMRADKALQGIKGKRLTYHQPH